MIAFAGYCGYSPKPSSNTFLPTCDDTTSLLQQFYDADKDTLKGKILISVEVVSLSTNIILWTPLDDANKDNEKKKTRLGVG